MRERHEGRAHHLERELEHELEHTLHALQHHHRKDCDVTLETPPTAAAPPIDAPTPDPASGAVPGDPAAGATTSSPAPTTTFTVTGTVTDDGEPALVDALRATVANSAGAVTGASYSSANETAPVDLTVPPAPALTVDECLAKLRSDALALGAPTILDDLDELEAAYQAEGDTADAGALEAAPDAPSPAPDASKATGADGVSVAL